jgi:hypothetical protein
VNTTAKELALRKPKLLAARDALNDLGSLKLGDRA